jgi:hypothetical protein
MIKGGGLLGGKLAILANGIVREGKMIRAGELFGTEADDCNDISQSFERNWPKNCGPESDNRPERDT